MLAARNAPLRASSDPINGSAHPLNLPTFSHRSLALLPLIPFFGNSEFSFRFSAPRALCKCDVTNSLRIAQRFHSFVLGYFFSGRKFITALFIFYSALPIGLWSRITKLLFFLNPPVSFPASVVSQSAKCWLHSPLTYHLINLTLTHQLSWYLNHISQRSEDLMTNDKVGNGALQTLQQAIFSAKKKIRKKQVFLFQQLWY